MWEVAGGGRRWYRTGSLCPRATGMSTVGMFCMVMWWAICVAGGVGNPSCQGNGEGMVAVQYKQVLECRTMEAGGPAQVEA